MAEIAVFGGTFDPPTKAHEAIIQACLERDDMDEVWVMPSGTRVDKPGMQNDESRLALLGLVKETSFVGSKRLHISDFELQLPRPTKTYITAQALQAAHPEHRFWYVYGADSYKHMHTWEEGEWLRSTIGMLLIKRVGYELPEETARIRHMSIKECTVKSLSSTMVRQAVASSRPLDTMVNREVAAYIQDNKLYQQAVQ